MRAFRFPLEPLRVLRRQKERLAQQRYAQSLLACNAAAAQLETASRDLQSARDFLVRELNAGMPAAKIMNLRTWCLALEIKHYERKAAFAESRRISDLAFQEMSAATRDREGLDRFYDKTRRLHAQEALREEQKNFDELAIQLNGAPGLLQSAGASDLTES